MRDLTVKQKKYLDKILREDWDTFPGGEGKINDHEDLTSGQWETLEEMNPCEILWNTTDHFIRDWIDARYEENFEELRAELLKPSKRMRF